LGLFGLASEPQKAQVHQAGRRTRKDQQHPCRAIEARGCRSMIEGDSDVEEQSTESKSARKCGEIEEIIQSIKD
jgi:hypothetical protein